LELFEACFGFVREEIKGNNAIAIAKDDTGFTLVLMTDKNGAVEYPRNFHFGFFVDSPVEVEQVHTRLKQYGIELQDAPARIRDTYGFYFHFDSMLIEVGYRPGVPFAW
jgi:hypothetical protein